MLCTTTAAVGLLVLGRAGVSYSQQVAPSLPPYGIVVSKDVMVTMRDGTQLATDIYLPAINGTPAPGRFPVILERTPYNKEGIEGWASYFVPRGYVAIGQDVRGRYNSQLMRCGSLRDRTGAWMHMVFFSGRNHLSSFGCGFNGLLC